MEEDNNNSLHHSHGFRLRIKIKGPTRPADVDDHNNIKKMNEQQPNHFMCGICNKGFKSVHALNGHTRVHSHKVPKDTPQGPCCESDNSTKPLPAPMCKKISRRGIATTAYNGTSVLRWSASRKRSPRRLSKCSANSCLENGFEVDPLMLEAASALLLLANGNVEDHEVKIAATDHVDLPPPPVPLTKKLRIQENVTGQGW